MTQGRLIKIALVGNPNTGKTSLFNQLTGLNQKVGNYPGITVEKKVGKSKISSELEAEIVDLPGTYSINPTSLDEHIVIQSLINEEGDEYPDMAIVVAEVEHLKRNLLLYTQVKDLGIPTVLAINMSDQLERKGIEIDIELMSRELGCPVVLISSRKGRGINDLKEAIINLKPNTFRFWDRIVPRIDEQYFADFKEILPVKSTYNLWLYTTQIENLESFTEHQKAFITSLKEDKAKLKKYQHKETVLRYQIINEILKKSYKRDVSKAKDLRSKFDKVLTHRVFGYIIFTAILLVIFQSIYDWASLPMDLIDAFFANLSTTISQVLPAGKLNDLISEGVIPGIGGIVIFIPQIAILFLFVAILEETGYMSRVVFLMDKIMRRYGMSGKSVVPLISGTAGAIPAIMAARNIGSWKERLITILVTPFITCSARLPVYAIIIALVIPQERVLGFLSLQGLVLLMLYLLGFIAPLASGYILHKVLKIKSRTLFVIEMPDYKLPSLKNVFYTVVDKTKAFVFGAGKIILAISIVLWFLASHGLEKFNNAEEYFESQQETLELNIADKEQALASYKLEHSYVGMMGKAIEPAIEPLGYDWKIGIALVSSFAAREVFVGTLATIYSVGSDDDENNTIKARMASEINPETGKSRFNLPVGMSLMIFYAFAMQCMSTLAIVKRETNSWKWPMLQLFGMGLIAYIASYLTYIALV